MVMINIMVMIILIVLPYELVLLGPPFDNSRLSPLPLKNMCSSKTWYVTVFKCLPKSVTDGLLAVLVIYFLFNSQPLFT
jgi:hypothetical protein